MDPPRKGLDEAIVKQLYTVNRSQLIYVSCGFESFQKDCEQLLSVGWKIQEASGYLLFPGTNHVETLVLLEK